MTRRLVQLAAQKVHALVKMNIPKLSLLDHPVVDFPLELHHVQQHLVVGPTGKEDLARVEFVERAADRPDVERAVVR